MSLARFKRWLATYGPSATVGDGSVTTAKLAADAVDGTKIADNAVDSEHVTAGAIDTAHLAADVIDGTKIADNAIGAEHIAAGAVGASEIADGTVLEAEVGDGAITNAKIAAGANLDLSKIAIADGKIMIGSGATIGVAYTITGDLSISNAGVAAIAAGAIIDADINAAAAIAHTKLAAMTDGYILVGSGATVPTAVAMSGDVAIINDGTTAIQEGAVDAAMIEGLGNAEFIIGTDGTAANNTKSTMSSDATMTNAGVLTIASLAINNAKVATAAAIAVTKLEGLADAAMLVGVDGTGANNGKVVMSGDVTMINDGTTTIGALKISNGMIATAAAIVVTKFEGLADGEFVVGVDGTGANNAKVTFSGDIAVTNAGIATIQAGAVESTMMASAKYPTAIVPASCHPVATIKDLLPDTGDGTTIGLADAAGGLLTVSTSNSNQKEETLAFDVVLPENYVDGEAIDIRVRAQVDVARANAQTVDLVVKQMSDTLGSDICTTGVQSIGTAGYTNEDFVITPTGLVAGDLLHVELTADSDDTGGSSNGVLTISRIELRSTNRV